MKSLNPPAVWSAERESAMFMGRLVEGPPVLVPITDLLIEIYYS